MQVQETTTKLRAAEPRGTWVQAERAALEKLAHLMRENPRAANLLIMLVSKMDERGAIVMSQQTLATFCKCSLATIKRAVSDLTKGNWIQTVSIGSGRGSTLAYVVNSRVAWADSRDNLKYAYFNARVLVSEEDNPVLGTGPLNQIPALGPDDILSLHGLGGPPPNQGELEETLSGLPSISTAPQQDEAGQAPALESDQDQSRLL